MWLLARRSLGVRPGRTLLFLSGFALAVGVMIALLSVGEAIVGQARDKDLVGGGDLVLVPEGSDVDVLKLGGVTAMFATIPNARFVHRQLLRGPRFADVIAEASPVWAGRPVFLRARPGAPVVQGLASATVPSLERAVSPSSLPPGWTDSPGEARFALLEGPALYDEMDHAHRPGVAQAASWAEWWYFNLLDPASGRFAYLSYFVAGDPFGGRATGSLSIQLGAPGRPATRHAFVVPVDSTAVSLDRAEVTIAGPAGRATVRVVDGVYRLEGRFRDALGGSGVRLELEVVPRPRAYVPPVVLTGAGGFTSGYVVPAVLARATGTIEVGASRTSFDQALAYHDHNWGTWRDVAWDWGQVQGPDADVALVYASVHAAGLGRSRHVVFVGAADGFLGVLRPDSIVYGGWHDGPRLDGRPVRVPGTIALHAAGEGDTLEVSLRVEDVAASRPPGDPRAPGGGRVFLQMRGAWQVRGRVGGRRLDFTAPGAAETFVHP
jgi:hypothetical protein